MGQNRCGKICSHRSANSDKKRALVLSISTKIRGMIHSFLLVVISPAVSDSLFGKCPVTRRGLPPEGAARPAPVAGADRRGSPVARGGIVCAGRVARHVPTRGR